MRYLLPMLLLGVAQAQLAKLPELTDLEPEPGTVLIDLTAQSTGESLFPYRYAALPPVIRAKRGDMLVVDLQNGLDQGTTVHWHGVEVPWAMDGVTWMREPVRPGGTFTYQFELTQAGTFWFHPHFNTNRQVDGGLYGVLVVEDPTEPAVDEDLVLVFDIPVEDVAASTQHGHGRLHSRWQINRGDAPVTYAAQGGSTVRARMINVSSAGYLALRWPGMRQIAGDQGLLPRPVSPEVVILGPGDRAEFEWAIADSFVVETLSYSLNGGFTWADPVPLINVQVANPAAPSPREWPTRPAAPTPDPGYTDVLYAFAGSDRTGEWLINGEKFPAVTIAEVPRGQPAIIEVRNLSPTEHPFHLHGMRFEVLSINGEPPAFRTVEDTINLAIRDVVRLLVVPPNPGDWMAHCHILPHAEDGMMTVLRVD